MIRHISSAQSLARLGVATMLMRSLSHTVNGSPAASASTRDATKYPKPGSCDRGRTGRAQCTPLTAEMRATAPSRARSVTTSSLATLSTP
jgi:hypothetical protein